MRNTADGRRLELFWWRSWWLCWSLGPASTAASGWPCSCTGSPRSPQRRDAPLQKSTGKRQSPDGSADYIHSLITDKVINQPCRMEAGMEGVWVFLFFSRKSLHELKRGLKTWPLKPPANFHFTSFSVCRISFTVNSIILSEYKINKSGFFDVLAVLIVSCVKAMSCISLHCFSLFWYICGSSSSGSTFIR